MIALAGAGCTGVPSPTAINTALTPATHTRFPITSGPHAVDCSVCHGGFDSFQDFSCFNCHGHEVQATVDAAHTGVSNYAYASPACYACHTDGNAVGVPTDAVFDPKADVTVSAGIATWSGTSITAVATQSETLQMRMLHGSTAYDAAANGSCSNCHASLTTGSYYPGVFHASLAALGLSQPATCGDCHAPSISLAQLGGSPVGFVGPTASTPPRTPPSGEMKHDAVAWSGGAPATTALVSTACATCHQAPSKAGDTWAMALSGATPAVYHAALGSSEPASCIDCHANTRPTAPVTLTSQNDPGISGSAKLQFDHTVAAASGDCATCHAGSTTTWAGGQFHANVSTATSCVSCHAAERPTSDTGWASTTFQDSPFDYGTNVIGKTHGDGLDCASCHSSTKSWVGGSFPHGPGTVAATTCAVCHTTQRPDLVLGAADAGAALGFDHATDGTADCFACHQATVVADRYLDYFKPGTLTLPGGDWQGGVGTPVCITTGGFTIPDPPASSTATAQTPATGTCQPGNALPHPTVKSGESCTVCHANGTAAGTAATGYDHVALPKNSCNACHEAGSDLVTPAWNGVAATASGAGDTRPFTVTDLVPRGCENTGKIISPNHYYPVDCYECHVAPTGTVGTLPTGSGYSKAWTFPHDACGTIRPTTCVLCHDDKGECGC